MVSMTLKAAAIKVSPRGRSQFSINLQAALSLLERFK